MKTLDLVVMMLCLQIGVLMVGLIEIQPGVFLNIGSMNMIYAGGISNIASEFQNIQTLTQSLNGNWISFQTISISVLGVSIPVFFLPSVQILGNIGVLGGIIISLIGIVAGLLFYSTILPGTFYTAILIAIIPYSATGTILATFLGYSIGAVQSVVLLIELVKLVLPGGGGKE